MGGLRVLSVVLLGLMALHGPAVADMVTCSDAENAARIEYDIAFEDSEARGAGLVTRVHGWFRNFEVGTDADAGGRQPETISDQVSGYERLEIDLEDPALARIVLRLRLFRDFRYDNTDKEYAERVVAGTLSVMGEGVWAVTCTGW